jgi:transcriptional regulator with XRE-family HTH domain
MVTDVRKLLQQELQRRCRDNPQYSMRAMAGFLGVSYSYLSKVLRGRSMVSDPMLEEIGRRLELKPEVLQALKAALEKRRQVRRRKLRSQFRDKFKWL